jgi:tRNA (cmo5U34)-methyltransferase
MTQDRTIRFDRDRASKYDRDILKVIPGYEALHAMAKAFLGMNLPEEAKLLIVGAGTGKEILNLSQSHLRWQFTGVEPSAEMMAIAQERLAQQRLSEKTQLHLGYTDTLPETRDYHAATLMLVMHFVSDDGAKLSLLQSIAKRLKPGASLILADLHGDRTSHSFQQLMSAWRFFRLQDLGDMSIEEFEADWQRVKNSIHFVSEARIIELLKATGFDEIVKFYNAFAFGGWIAKFNG